MGVKDGYIFSDFTKTQEAPHRKEPLVFTVLKLGDVPPLFLIHPV